MSLTWNKLADRFRNIIEDAGGRTKSKSGLIHIEIDSCDGQQYHVELGTYDIGMWPSWTIVGNFETEEKALEAVSKKLDEAAAEVKREKEQDQLCNEGRCECCD
jgi:hypothetical protein